MSLPTLITVQKLQAALHAKAKGEPKFRFYALYDKVYRYDVLLSDWHRCLNNGGAPGVDGQTFADIEAYGVEKWGQASLGSDPVFGFCDGFYYHDVCQVKLRWGQTLFSVFVTDSTIMTAKFLSLGDCVNCFSVQLIRLLTLSG